MSKPISGPLTPIDDARLTFLASQAFCYPSPQQKCPRDQSWLRVFSAVFHGGIVSGVTWWLQCDECHTAYEYVTAMDNYEDAYGHARPEGEPL